MESISCLVQPLDVVHYGKNIQVHDLRLYRHARSTYKTRHFHLKIRGVLPRIAMFY